MMLKDKNEDLFYNLIKNSDATNMRQMHFKKHKFCEAFMRL